MKETIGIIGFGNMGSAIAERIKLRYQVYVFDKDKTKTDNLSSIKVCADAIDLVNQVEVAMLAVKPQDFDSILNEIKDYTKGKLIISIAAGISTKYIEGRLREVSVVRGMPNLPAKVGKGMICLYKGKSATDKDLNFTEELFSNLGETLILHNEDMINDATAVSGSGPGFFYSLIQSLPQTKWEEFGDNVFIPKLKYAAEQIGFSSQEANVLASVTTSGSIALLKVTGLSPESLRLQVASKDGTTEAGLKKLQGNIKHLTEAVEAAKKRAEELSKKE